MRAVKIPNPGANKPYGPASGGQNVKVGKTELVVNGLGGASHAYGPAAKYDRKPNVNKDSIPNGHTCKRFNEMG